MAFLVQERKPARGTPLFGPIWSKYRISITIWSYDHHLHGERSKNPHAPCKAQLCLEKTDLRLPGDPNVISHHHELLSAYATQVVVSPRDNLNNGDGI